MLPEFLSAFYHFPLPQGRGAWPQDGTPHAHSGWSTISNETSAMVLNAIALGFFICFRRNLGYDFLFPHITSTPHLSLLSSPVSALRVGFIKAISLQTFMKSDGQNSLFIQVN